MRKIKQMIHILFPLIDHLYIFQLLEYQKLDFLRWFIRYPFKRNLQHKNHLDLTTKTKILLLLSLLILSLISGFISFYVIATLNILIFLIAFFYLSIFSPLFLIVAQMLFSPIENYFKNKLLQQAQSKIGKFKDLTVIAIVGSFAKTSTKDILYTLLWKDFRVVKTPKSFNTEVSIARTILNDLKDNTEIFIVEMDAYHKGEIKKLCQLAQPNIGVITGIGPQHLERFGSIDTLVQTQFELAEYLTKKSGQLFLNTNDDLTIDYQGQYEAVRKLFYGFNLSEDFSASAIKQLTNGTEFIVNSKKERHHIEIPLPGKHNVSNFLAAVSIASTVGLPFKTIQKRAALLLPTEHRLEVREIPGLTIIDNTYNTNPIASQSALKLLESFNDKQKIIVTPGFVELGSSAELENKKLAHQAAKIADQIVIVGENSKSYLKSGLQESNFPQEMTHFVKTTQNALDLLSQIAEKNSVVLLENDLPDQYF